MDSWKYGLDYAMIVGPIYQLPTNKSDLSTGYYEERMYPELLSFGHARCPSDTKGSRKRRGGSSGSP